MWNGEKQKKYGIVERIFICFNAEIIEWKNKRWWAFIVMNNDTIYLLGERYQGITIYT